MAYSEPGGLNRLRKDPPELRRRLLSTLPEELRPNVERKLDERTEWQVLKILVDRVRRWHAPGVLFLGDAVHTMSPSGGQGLNLAARDTFVAANHLLGAVMMLTVRKMQGTGGAPAAELRYITLLAQPGSSQDLRPPRDR
ncbi:FAD-dependent monooxygenase [Pyxidicoccus caerfyrddinensis]|uniref:FAD-dependent monooxygenase n=1 Tax=Pyxidicoccus caerfyrddinensis TaxID=2709663 RepID=UPI001F0754D7|nr:FAD-dependent monooxygenase [Pyxidicoccus caerfyrddinensis]